MSEALEDSQISSISVAQEPTFARKPVSPNKALVLLAGAFLAFAGLVASILLAEKLNDRVRGEAEPGLVDRSACLGMHGRESRQ